MRILRSLIIGLPVAFVLLGGLGPASADVLVTAEGLVLEGTVVHDAEAGRYVVTTPSGSVTLAADRVASVTKGTVGPRTAHARKAALLASDDTAGWYRLALEAEAAGLADLASAAYEKVIALEPDHTAARRALGHEKTEDGWVTQAEARLARGLVLYGGRWLLPAEVEAAVKATRPASVTPPSDVKQVIHTVATAPADGVLHRAARLALAGTAHDLRLGAALNTLLDSDPVVRATSARLLGEWGDEAALRALIFSAARDMDATVRREAVLAAGSFGHEDTAVPFVRALGSKSTQLAVNAVEALGALGDPRAMRYLVKKLTSHGYSGRNYVSFLNQVSYVRDYDVEIAQASNIANPDVGTILEGVVLDVRVLDASYTRTYIEAAIVGAMSKLAGRRFANADEVRAWYAQNETAYPGFEDETSGRAPRGRRGGVIGVPPSR